MNPWRREGTGGLVLCGGRSSRMGFEKARLRFPDGTLLSRVLARMRQVAHPVAVSVADGQHLPPLPAGTFAVPDGIGNQGPLWGLLEGFRALAGQCRQVLVMPVDMPFFTEEWMARLLDGLAGHRACLYRQEGFANALVAAYRVGLMPKLEALVAEGKRRPIFLIEGEAAAILDAPVAGAGLHPLTDVDTPEAYRAALAIEGVGRLDAPEVTVTLVAADAVGDPEAPALGYLALHAATAGEVLAAAERLYPDLPLVGARLQRLGPEEGGAGDDPATPLTHDAPLWRGEALRLELAAPAA